MIFSDDNKMALIEVEATKRKDGKNIQHINPDSVMLSCSEDGRRVIEIDALKKHKYKQIILTFLVPE